MTYQDIFYQSLRKVGQIRPGYVASPEILADCLGECIALLDEMNAERTSNYTHPDYVYPVTGPGSQSGGNGYQIGPSGADWVGPRPTSIIRANLVMTNLSTQKVYIPLVPITQEEWAGLSVRQIPATSVTNLFWYDPQWPNGVFNVFPPLNGNSIELFTWGVLSPPASLSTVWSMPPGYQDVVVYGVAERMYGLTTKEAVLNPLPYGVIAARALAARQKIALLNRSMPRLATDFPHKGRSGTYDRNITYTGYP